MSGDWLAGVDVGTTNTKVGRYRVDGSRVDLRSWPTPSDAGDLVATVVAGLAALVAGAGRPPAVVGVAGMAETGVVVEPDLTPLHPLITWADPRGAAGAERIRAEVGADELFALTGVNLATKTPLARWRWLADTHPELLTGPRLWLGAPELVAAALTANPATDPTLAGRSGGVDVRAGRYHPDLLAAAGISPDHLPPIIESGRIGGRCRTESSRRAGLPDGTPVVVAGHDHLVAGYAAGVRHSGEQMDSMGTAEAVITLTRQPPTVSGDTGVSWNRYVDGRHHVLISGLAGAGRLVDWFLAGYLTGVDHPGFGALLDTVSHRPTGIVVEPYLAGRAAPAPDPGRALTIHGMRPRHTIADLALALLEGAASQVRWMAEQHLTLLGHPGTGTVTVAGGPTRLGSWMRVKAVLWPDSLRVVADPDATCAGAAIVAAEAALGVPAPVLAARQVVPDPGERGRYQRFYRESFLPAVTAAGSSPADPWEVR